MPRSCSVGQGMLGGVLKRALARLGLLQLICIDTTRPLAQRIEVQYYALIDTSYFAV